MILACLFLLLAFLCLAIAVRLETLPENEWSRFTFKGTVAERAPGPTVLDSATLLRVIKGGRCG